jgi:NAD(P)-dependent dehydrogenase (short-subunit alcohol dehydrogenase family)
MNILITGVTRGLGRALAEFYIAQGHTIIGCGRSAEILNLRFSYPAPHDFTALDVTEENRVALWAEKISARYGAPDILINNAALINTPAPLWSGWGRSTSPEVAPYCASKYAIEGLTLALAQELPAGLAAIALNPGVIDTAMLRLAFGEGAGRHPKAEAWAKIAGPFILNLTASDNGQSLSVPASAP